MLCCAVLRCAGLLRPQVEERETAQRQRAIEIAFWQRGADGEPLKQGPPEIAAALGVPLGRAEMLLQVRGLQVVA